MRKLKPTYGVLNGVESVCRACYFIHVILLLSLFFTLVLAETGTQYGFKAP
jgi:hypothetical protein